MISHGGEVNFLEGKISDTKPCVGRLVGPREPARDLSQAGKGQTTVWYARNARSRKEGGGEPKGSAPSKVDSEGGRRSRVLLYIITITIIVGHMHMSTFCTQLVHIGAMASSSLLCAASDCNAGLLCWTTGSKEESKETMQQNPKIRHTGPKAGHKVGTIKGTKTKPIP